MEYTEVIIPTQTPEGVWCFNASFLVRKKGTNKLSYYIESEDDTLEVAFRERIGTDGLIYGCEMIPYTWTYSEIYPIVVNPERTFEDPRFWLFNSKSHMTFSKYPSLLFGEYSVYEKKLKNIITLPFAGNGQGALQKNWGFFETNGHIAFVFLPSPLIIAEIELTTNTVNMINLSEDKWLDETEFRGGSSPVLNPLNGLYYIFVHKTCNYNIWAICFQKDTDGKWKVKGYTKEQLNKPAGELIHFVSSAIYDTLKHQWILSGGICDKHVGIWLLPHDELQKKMTWISSPIS